MKKKRGTIKENSLFKKNTELFDHQIKQKSHKYKEQSLQTMKHTVSGVTRVKGTVMCCILANGRQATLFLLYHQTNGSAIYNYGFNNN